jgi:hypothetical protein
MFETKAQNEAQPHSPSLNAKIKSQVRAMLVGGSIPTASNDCYLGEMIAGERRIRFLREGEIIDKSEASRCSIPFLASLGLKHDRALPQ